MFQMSKWVMQAYFKNLNFNSFSMIYKTLQFDGFWPLQLFPENSRIHQDSNSQSGNSLRSVRVHSLTLSCTLRSMKRDSQASLLACAFASPCLGHKPKVKVTTNMNECYIIYFYNITRIFFNIHFQHGKIFSNIINIFCHVNKIFKYSTMSFMAIVMVVKFIIAITWTC